MKIFSAVFQTWLTNVLVDVRANIVYSTDYILVYLVLNLFIIVPCGFVYFCNVWVCVCVGFVLYGCVRLM